MSLLPRADAVTPDHPILVRARRTQTIADLLAALAGIAIVWLLLGCAHVAPYDPCRDSSRPVGLLTPEERRAMCIHEPPQTTVQEAP